MHESTLSAFYRVFYAIAPYIISVDFYQPVYGRRRNRGATRICEDRWNVMAPALGLEENSVLDIGCNIGYFSFKAAEQGNLVFGIEPDPLFYTICNAIKEVVKAERCVFIKEKVDLEFLAKIPSFDVVINLSVFHHWVKAFGQEESLKMMKVLASKCKRKMFFETGQSNETGTRWSAKLSFMGNRPDEWIEQFLLDIGFDNVEVVGGFPTGLTNVNRSLFLARK